MVYFKRLVKRSASKKNCICIWIGLINLYNSEAVTETCFAKQVFWNLQSKSLKNTSKNFIFSKVVHLKFATLLKMKSCKNIFQVFWLQISRGHF